MEKSIDDDPARVLVVDVPDAETYRVSIRELTDLTRTGGGAQASCDIDPNAEA